MDLRMLFHESCTLYVYTEIAWEACANAWEIVLLFIKRILKEVISHLFTVRTLYS